MTGVGSQCGGGYQFSTSGSKVVEVRYTLRAMNNYPNTDASGAAELRKKTSNQAYYVENKGDGKVALRMKNAPNHAEFRFIKVQNP